MNQTSYPVPLILVGVSALALSTKVLHVAQPPTVRLALRSWRREIMDVLQTVQHIVLAPRVDPLRCRSLDAIGGTADLRQSRWRCGSEAIDPKRTRASRFCRDARP